MEIGSLDFDTRCKYMLVYKDKINNTFNTWTLQESGLRVNYPLMKEDNNIEFLGIYKKLSDDELMDIMLE